MCRWLCQYTFLIWISNFYKWYAYLFTTSRPEGSFLLLFCKINELVFVTKIEIFPADSQIYGSSSQTWMFSFTNSTQSYQITKNIARPFSDVSFTTENIPRSLKMSLKYYATDCRHVPSFLWHVQYQRMESRQKKFDCGQRIFLKPLELQSKEKSNKALTLQALNRTSLALLSCLVRRLEKNNKAPPPPPPKKAIMTNFLQKLSARYHGLVDSKWGTSFPAHLFAIRGKRKRGLLWRRGCKIRILPRNEWESLSSSWGSQNKLSVLDLATKIRRKQEKSGDTKKLF